MPKNVVKYKNFCKSSYVDTFSKVLNLHHGLYPQHQVLDVNGDDDDDDGDDDDEATTKAMLLQ